MPKASAPITTPQVPLSASSNQTDSIAQKTAVLEELTARMNTPEQCPLYATATNVVPGEGNVDAEVMIIGEAPGKNEDEQGRPFVGAAGKFLNELLASINLDREKVYIANIIKHRPPGNRDPLPNEIAAYAPWLEEQIRIINPKLIVTLGRFSMEYLLGPGFSITKIHGQPKRRNSRVVMPLYHPAAALYNGSLRSVLTSDFAKIPKVLAIIHQGATTSHQSDAQKAEEQKQLLEL